MGCCARRERAGGVLASAHCGTAWALADAWFPEGWGGADGGDASAAFGGGAGTGAAVHAAFSVPHRGAAAKAAGAGFRAAAAQVVWGFARSARLGEAGGEFRGGIGMAPGSQSGRRWTVPSGGRVAPEVRAVDHFKANRGMAGVRVLPTMTGHAMVWAMAARMAGTRTGCR